MSRENHVDRTLTPRRLETPVINGCATATLHLVAAASLDVQSTLKHVHVDTVLHSIHVCRVDKLHTACRQNCIASNSSTIGAFSITAQEDIPSAVTARQQADKVRDAQNPEGGEVSTAGHHR